MFIFMSDWAGYTEDEAFLDKNKSLEGRTVGEIARDRDAEPFDALLDLAIEEGLKTSFLPLVYGDDDHSWQVRTNAWADSRTVVGASDAGAHLDMIDTFSFTTQMLGNTVARRGLLSVEQAVHYLTEVPARLVGLKTAACFTSAAAQASATCGPAWTCRRPSPRCRPWPTSPICAASSI
ncbi:MAG: hypothetical protein U5K56_20395 [Halioglobus sp.]|nr:hypothetical protein [Halioglobus sp.]